MNRFKKIALPATLSVSVLGLAACGSNSGETIISSKAGDVTTQNVIDNLGKDEVAKSAFQILLNDILKDKYGKKVDEDKINKQTDDEVKQAGGKEKFNQILAQQQPGMTVEKYKESKVTNEYRKLLMNEAIKVTDKDIADNVKNASHILIKVKSSSDKTGLSKEEAKQKAEEILKQVKENPKDFGKIAKKESGDPGSKANDGSLGYVVKGDTVPEFEKALFKLKENEISDLVKTEYGYHIIKADSQKMSKSEKEKVIEKVRQAKIQKDPNVLIDAYKKLLKDYKVDYKDKEVKKYVEEQILTAKSSSQQQ